ncbi:hypothetical protein BDA99DRAFT_434548 [Phascolomyces articulosus]|uniref:Enoyl reductase (ER) domain-containing protein n=1 Tax=Phascolomyces articulosus TaxID=60185 RepID=A0AAD5K5Z7_9FUNG|nr:hypothetical protein BDA99DRAFT_434548 [Phascolomyces articulosus]
MVKNTQVIFNKIPTNYVPVAGEHMVIHESEFDLDAPLSDGQFMTKQLALSIDSYMRGRMRDPSIPSYVSAFEIGKPLLCGTMSSVVKSSNPLFKEGDLVYSSGGRFEQYSLVDGNEAKDYKIRNESKETGLPPSYSLGILGMPGFTAYVGMMKFGHPKKDETLYVSAAASSVGQLAGQLGKRFGMYVVGSAGSDKKMTYLKEIGFDDAFNYKTDDISTNLDKQCPKGIDVYFDNVGGKTLEAAIAHCNHFSRIVACGMISQYSENPETPHNLMELIKRRVQLTGYIVSDHADMEDEFRKNITQWLLAGEINYKESVADGIEKAPEALIDVLQGKNLGKQIVKVADL